MSESQQPPTPSSTTGGGNDKVIELPSRLPPPTGNILWDSLQSARHITAVPCARESLLAGIGAGAGIGFIRGFSCPPIKAGNWAVATFALTSIVSWQICQSKFERERQQVTSMLEQGPRRKAVIQETEVNSS